MPVTYLLLFRGVGGPVQLPVAHLRAALTRAGFLDATTYINSGNALVRSTLARADALARVADICRKQFNYERPIFIPTAAEWEAVIAHDPFPHKAEGRHVHAVLMAGAPRPDAVQALRALAVGDEALVVPEGAAAKHFGPYHVAYLHTPHGFGTSKLAEKFDKGIGVANTARNWNTVLKMHALAQGLAGR
ncbi:MAG: DUF1697 domain-containing protein [Flavobacteriales bacterium]|jgi:uncharacterized protein (DUF1697 family)|nr:DUF1697 domain-containing protein [Flavobacteriales bacterium]